MEYALNIQDALNKFGWLFGSVQRGVIVELTYNTGENISITFISHFKWNAGFYEQAWQIISYL